MRIGIAGPISTDDIADLLTGGVHGLPQGYYGAPLLGTLIRRLLAEGHDVYAYTTSADIARPVRVAGEGLRVTYCPVRRHALWPEGWRPGRILDLFCLERRCLEQAMRRDGPDVVHAHWTYEFAWAALDSGLPCVVTAHDSPRQVLKYNPSLYRLGRYVMARRVLGRSTLLTTVSPYMVSQLAGLAKAPIAVIPNPLDDAICRQVGVDGPTLPEDGHWRIAMSLNGWGSRKNPQPALRAFAQLRQAFPRAELHLFGSDYGPGELAQTWCRQTGLTEGVIFHGRQSHAVLMEQLRVMHVLLHPALEESFGMVLAEAMALGVVAVGGHQSGAVPWVLDEGRSGVLVDVTSSSAIHEALSGLLADPRRHAQLSGIGRRRVADNFSVSAVVKGYADMYRQAVERAMTADGPGGVPNAA